VVSDRLVVMVLFLFHLRKLSAELQPPRYLIVCHLCISFVLLSQSWEDDGQPELRRNLSGSKKLKLGETSISFLITPNNPVPVGLVHHRCLSASTT